MNHQEARRRAQEAREDAEAYASPLHSTHDLADLIDALAGEVEQLRGLLHVTENNANEHANDSFVLQRQMDRLRKENEGLKRELRRLRGELDAANREVAFGAWGGYGGTEGESDEREAR